MSATRAHPELRERFRAFAAAEVAPRVLKNDAGQRFDRSLWQRIGASGLFGLQVPQALGGEGRSLSEFTAALEGFAAGSMDLGLAVSVVAHAGCAIPAVVEFASEAQKREWLPRLMSGEWLAAVANAEPRAGTDVLAMRAHAESLDGRWRLTARKRSITNVGAADLIFTSARSGGTAERPEFSIFAVRPAARVWQRPSRELMGLRTSATGTLLARRADLAADALLGPQGHALPFFRFVFALERLLIGSLFLSAIERSLGRAVHHAERRTSFGEVLGRHQYVQEKIVRMRVAMETLSALLDRTRADFLAGSDVSAALSIIKFHGAEAAQQATEDLMTVLGGRGMLKTSRAEKDFRDVFGLSILGGTQELQKIVIYRETAKAMTTLRDDDEAVEIEVVPFRRIDRALETALVTLVGRVFADQPQSGRYYYDTVPDAVVVARVKQRVVGFRMVIRRSVTIEGRSVRVAGLGIAVDPAFQNRGIGTRLTAETLRYCEHEGDELALAFLLSRAAEPLLSSFGFRRLNATVRYEHRETHQPVTEPMACFARALTDTPWLDTIERLGDLWLGLGTW